MRPDRIYIVDDDDDARNQWKELIETEWPACDVRAYAHLSEAMTGLYSPQVLVIDVSSVAPNMMSDVAHAYRPIAHYSNCYPACQIIITSGMSRDATEEVITEVSRVSGREAWYGGMGMWETMKPKIQKALNS